MSPRNPNPVKPKAPKRVAIASPAVSTTGWSVGFWWAELSQPYLALTKKGYEVEVFPPGPADARRTP